MGIESDSLVPRSTDWLLVWHDTIVMGYTNYSIPHFCYYFRFTTNGNRRRGVSMAS